MSPVKRGRIFRARIRIGNVSAHWQDWAERGEKRIAPLSISEGRLQKKEERKIRRIVSHWPGLLNEVVENVEWRESQSVILMLCLIEASVGSPVVKNSRWEHRRVDYAPIA